MKKIVQRTKGFEKAFVKLQKKWQKKFIKQLELFLENEFHPLLKTHKLKGDRENEWSFSITHDIRAIYIKKVTNSKTEIIFTFIDIGSHSKVY